MRVAVLFDLSSPKSGGAFTFNKQIYDEVSNCKAHAGLEFFKVHARISSKDVTPDIPLPGIFLHRFYLFTSVLKQLYGLMRQRTPVSMDIARANSLNLILRKNKIDLVWAVQPLSFPLTIPYMTTVWDIAHRITPYFPEISGTGSIFEAREKISRKVLNRALMIIVGTKRGAGEISLAYGVNSERVFVNPLPVRGSSVRVDKVRLGNRFIYPANFWPHKNHLLLMDGLKLAQNRVSNRIELVLTGSDKGTLRSVKQRVQELSLEGNVTFAGFVDDVSLAHYYSTSNAIVFPSLVGPDNLPPLEALSYGARVIVADIPGAREQFGDFADYFNPFDPHELADRLVNHLLDFTEFQEPDPEVTDFLNWLSPKEYLRRVINEIQGKSTVINAIQG